MEYSFIGGSRSMSPFVLGTLDRIECSGHVLDHDFSRSMMTCHVLDTFFTTRGVRNRGSKSDSFEFDKDGLFDR